MFDELVEIIPHLFLGSLESVEQLFLLNSLSEMEEGRDVFRKSIKQIISIGCRLNENCYENTSPDMNIVSFPEIQDSPEHYILPLCEAVCFCIRDCVENKRNVIVHCVYGQSRSVAVILFYLIYFFSSSYSLLTAYEYIRSKRPSICVNPGFLTQLAIFEQFLQQRRKAETIEEVSIPDEVAESESEEINPKRKLRDAVDVDWTYELIMTGLRSSYPEAFLYPSLLDFRSQISNKPLLIGDLLTDQPICSSCIYCKSCQSMITSISSRFQSIPDLPQLQSLQDQLTDDFWKSYFPLTSSSLKEFMDMVINLPGEEMGYQVKRRKVTNGKVDSQGLSKKYDFKQFVQFFPVEVIYQRLGEHFYILFAPFLSTKETNTIYQCNGCQIPLGRQLKKCFPIIGRHCLIDVILVNKSQSIIRNCSI